MREDKNGGKRRRMWEINTNNINPERKDITYAAIVQAPITPERCADVQEAQWMEGGMRIIFVPGSEEGFGFGVVLGVGAEVGAEAEREGEEVEVGVEVVREGEGEADGCWGGIFDGLVSWR